MKKLKKGLLTKPTFPPKLKVKILPFNQYAQTSVASKIWKMRYFVFCFFFYSPFYHIRNKKNWVHFIPFRSATDLSNVCLIKYGWIVKLETISYDVVPIVKNLYKCIYNDTGLHNIHLNVLHQFSEKLSHYYNEAVHDFRKEFSAQSENITYTKYREDFETFGYQRYRNLSSRIHF